jgi:soluble lytic murein transglycosylase
MLTISRSTARKILAANLVAAALWLGLGVARLWSAAHVQDRILIEEGREAGVDPRLLSAVVWKESRFKAAAIGAAGEVGLMQIMPAAAADWARAHRRDPPAPRDLLDPRLNVRVGAWYLAKGHRDWQDHPQPEARALAQYNAGPSVARRWHRTAEETGKPFTECISYPSTRLYVEHILRRYRFGG